MTYELYELEMQNCYTKLYYTVLVSSRPCAGRPSELVQGMGRGADSQLLCLVTL